MLSCVPALPSAVRGGDHRSTVASLSNTCRAAPGCSHARSAASARATSVPFTRQAHRETCLTCTASKVHRRCHFSSTPSLGGGRARVDSLGAGVGRAGRRSGLAPALDGANGVLASVLAALLCCTVVCMTYVSVFMRYDRAQSELQSLYNTDRSRAISRACSRGSTRYRTGTLEVWTLFLALRISSFGNSSPPLHALEGPARSCSRAAPDPHRTLGVGDAYHGARNANW